MNRTTNAVPRKAKYNKILKTVKGYINRKNRCISMAILYKRQAKERSFIGRKLKKRVNRRKWNKVISIFAKNNNKNYSSVISSLMKKFNSRKEIYNQIRNNPSKNINNLLV